ncbi:hypothetical protein [Tenacibaculum finnmarkense]|uniref:hypothetical protein n=1 Tax=Tenacibaculum finnmarkense TaxID=2781243 RepID=UPI001E38AA92|nr:hypothetical protein [Tenacibaculum finnmarkense]MCD8412474.1 hypothetical protein [Tenacibaculum finnmarkense genomovar ulcerans]MCG8206829.1 hypothetical protein [Tenacibaculum finnmarkense genomovar finnmarkense]MCG8722995.1 hypothetical protein [Tenacibaculum finnmarkense]MCG8741261.1 hypothetical protein [Tenacibaculum finnmarkense]MCG8764560.1 hypothetical protein [Tenacibaculum finnmarkense]
MQISCNNDDINNVQSLKTTNKEIKSSTNDNQEQTNKYKYKVKINEFLSYYTNELPNNDVDYQLTSEIKKKQDYNNKLKNSEYGTLRHYIELPDNLGDFNQRRIKDIIGKFRRFTMPHLSFGLYCVGESTDKSGLIFRVNNTPSLYSRSYTYHTVPYSNSIQFEIKVKTSEMNDLKHSVTTKIFSMSVVNDRKIGKYFQCFYYDSFGESYQLVLGGFRGI